MLRKKILILAKKSRTTFWIPFTYIILSLNADTLRENIYALCARKTIIFKSSFYSKITTMAEKEQLSSCLCQKKWLHTSFQTSKFLSSFFPLTFHFSFNLKLPQPYLRTNKHVTFYSVILKPHTIRRKNIL